MQIPTLKISDKAGGYIVINESDFDKKTMMLFEKTAAATFDAQMLAKMNKTQLLDFAANNAIEARFDDMTNKEIVKTILLFSEGAKDTDDDELTPE